MAQNRDMLAALTAGLMINYYQVGILFTTQVLEPSLSKLNPIAGFKRLFSLQALAQLLKSVIKIILITYFVYQFAILKNTEISMLTNAELLVSYKKRRRTGYGIGVADIAGIISFGNT